MKTQICIDPITNNFLDRNFQKLLFPYRCFQHVVFLSSFSIEYNCIRPHRVSYYIVSLIGTLMFISFHSYTVYMAKDFDKTVNKFMTLFLKINFFLFLIPFVSFYVLNIILRENHVQLILKIQKAFRLSNFKAYKKPIIRNWTGIVRHSLDFAISVAITGNFLTAIFFYTLLYFDVNLTYGASMIALIRDGIFSWISEVEYYSKLSSEFGEEKYSDRLKKLFESYINLLEAFDMFKYMFKFTTLFQTLDTFFHCLLYLQATIEAFRAGETHYGKYEVKLYEEVFVLWSLKNITFVTVFGLYCERFYMCVSEVDAACCRLLRSLQSTVEAKKLCKNVLRLNRVACNKMTACRLFTIDGRLPQKFISLVLEYAVVILQFAVLAWLRKTTLSN